MSLVQIFGEGRDLDVHQMCARAFVLFFVMMVLVRLAGMRAFGRGSSFDTIVVIMLGAVLSRALVGVSPAVPTVAASFVFVLLHRAISIATSEVPVLERLFKGRNTLLYRGGVFDLKAMRRNGISRADLDEAVRTKTHRLKITDVLEIRLESSGDLSVIEDVIGEARRVRTAIN